jgi:hypothetical protein
MQRRNRNLLAAGGAIAAAAAAIVVPGQLALSADHLDPPARTDPAVDPTPDFDTDIADLYAFHDADNLYLIETWGAPAATNLAGFFDRDMVHTINISTAPPATTPEIQISFRFGVGATPNEQGIQLTGLPGVNGTLTGPLETILSKDGVRVFSGVKDDPFFFDSQGLKDSRATGVLSIKNTRDRFAGLNASVTAIEIPRSRLGSTKLDLWVTTARFGGQK